MVEGTSGDKENAYKGECRNDELNMAQTQGRNSKAAKNLD